MYQLKAYLGKVSPRMFRLFFCGGHMVYLQRALFVLWTYFCLWIRFHMSPSNWYLPIHSTRNQLKNILAKSFDSIWRRLIITHSIIQTSWKDCLPGQSLTLHSWISLSSPWHFPPFLSWTILTRVLFLVPLPQKAEQTPSVQADHWHGISEKETFFCHARISYIYLKLVISQLFPHLSTIENWLTWTHIAWPGTLILDKWRTVAICVGINFATPVFLIVAFSF